VHDFAAAAAAAALLLLLLRCCCCCCCAAAAAAAALLLLLLLRCCCCCCCRYATPPEDPLLVIARDAAAGSDLLCLDELHVTDVADAMLLSRLFGQILGHGCMVCFTSNRPARDLYKGGLSRKYFEPFIMLIDERLLQLKVAGGRDYRAQHAMQHAIQQQQDVMPHSQQQRSSNDTDTLLAAAAAGAGAWWVGAGAGQQLQQHWQQLASQLAELHAAVGTAAAAAAAEAGSRSGSVQLPFGRKLWVPQALLSPAEWSAAGSADHDDQQQQQQQQKGLEAALFTFEQLCGNSGSRQSLEHAGALSANDYLALVRSCPVLFLARLPQLQPHQRDEARRLVTFVDIA
jgi:predicted ATPase